MKKRNTKKLVTGAALLLLSSGCTQNGEAISFGKHVSSLTQSSVAIVQPGLLSLQSTTLLGDINGDGFDDIAFADPEHDSGDGAHGAVLVAYGAADGVSSPAVLELEDRSFPGRLINISPAGDVNGDGLADFLVATPNYSRSCSVEDEAVPVNDVGTVYLVYGQPESLRGTTNLTSYSTVIQSPASCTSLGSELAALGDIDGDGFDDFTISAIDSEEVGNVVTPVPGSDRVLVFYGQSESFGDRISTVAATATIATETTAAVGGPSPIGDLNGDGYADWLISVSQAGNQNSILIVQGSASRHIGATTPSAITATEIRGDISGVRSVGVGDLDGDGFGDLAIAASFYNADAWQEPESDSRGEDPELNPTLFYLWYGSADIASALDIVNADATIMASESGDRGETIVSGDFDGDGNQDLAFGDPGFANGRGGVHFADGTGGRLSGVIVMDALQTSVSVGEWFEYTCNADGNDEECSQGENAGGYIGAGDITGDGTDELFVIGHRPADWVDEDASDRIYIVK